MTYVSHLFSQPLAEDLGWTLLHSLWQVTAIGILLAVLLLFVRRSPAIRHALALVALTLSAIMPAATFGWLRTTRSSAPSAAAVTRSVTDSARSMTRQISEADLAISPDSESLPETTFNLPEEFPAVAGRTAVRKQLAPSKADRHWLHSWTASADRLRPYLPWTVGLWAVGVCLLSVRLLRDWWSLRVCRIRSNDAVPVPLQRILTKLQHRMCLTRSIELRVSDEFDVPTVLGWVRPLILLPATAVTGLTDDQLAAVLAHELAHIRRHDTFTNLWQSLVETVLFYHPAVWWISMHVRRERENCCDDIAAAVCGDPVCYARALFQLETLRADHSTLALAASDGPLLARIRRLTDTSPRDRISPRGLVGLSTLSLVTLTVASLWWSIAAESAAAIDPKPNSGDPSSAADTTDYSNWTGAQIAAAIEGVIERYGRAECTAQFDQVRDSNAYFPDRQPLLIEGSGRWAYRNDGTRWLTDYDGFTVSMGQGGRVPRRVLSGFDGQRHFRFSSGRYEFGVEDRSTRPPADVFWNGARTRGWLLKAIRETDQPVTQERSTDDRPLVRITTVLGRATHDAGSDQPESIWHYSILLSPIQSWLPLEVELNRNGKPYATERLSDLRQTKDGDWYPGQIELRNAAAPADPVETKTRVTSFQVSPTFSAADFEHPVPLGVDVVDYRLGSAWHNDPWWPSLKDYMRSELDWPRADRSALHRLQSFADPEGNGEICPTIRLSAITAGSSEVQGDITIPAPRADVTVLHFFGGRLIEPTPQTLAALKHLHSLYEPSGLKIIGVVPSDMQAAVVRQTIRELDLPFPVAIDAPLEGQRGSTYAAFKTKTYTGTFVVDRDSRIHHVPESAAGPSGALSSLEQLVRLLLKVPDGKYLDGNGGQFSARLPEADLKRLQSEWITQFDAREGQSVIRGQLTPGLSRWVSPQQPRPQLEPIRQAQVKITPRLRLLNSNTTGSWTSLPRYKLARTVDVAPDGSFQIEGLRRGRYLLEISSDNYASATTTALIAGDNDHLEVRVTLETAGEIGGIVLDAAGQPISGAHVKATRRHADPDLLRKHTTANLPRQPAVTDTAGRFVFRGLHAGAFTLEATANGFARQELEAVPPGKMDAEFRLQPQN